MAALREPELLVRSVHAWAEPIERTLAAARGTPVQFVTPRVGEPVEFGLPFDNQAWYRQR